MQEGEQPPAGDGAQDLAAAVGAALVVLHAQRAADRDVGDRVRGRGGFPLSSLQLDRNPLIGRCRKPRLNALFPDVVTLENVRNFAYRSEHDFDERWETRTYDLSRLRATDMFLVYWGSPHIAHTIVSWVFEDAPPLAVSIETRKEVGESYSAVRGFFRQYELYYVVADERDVIGVRALHRGEDVYLYRLRTPLERSRAVLLDYLRELNELAERPRWYNALAHNCTTTIRQHAQAVAPANPWSRKILANGHLDELGYERGTIDTSLPFAELRAASAVSERARAAGDGPDFSRRIREGLPGMDAAASETGARSRPR